jgi:hypothetical protein
MLVRPLALATGSRTGSNLMNSVQLQDGDVGTTTILCVELQCSPAAHTI